MSAPQPHKSTSQLQLASAVLKGTSSLKHLRADDPFSLHSQQNRLLTPEEDAEELEHAALEALHAAHLTEKRQVVLRRRNGQLQVVDLARWRLSQRKSLLRSVMSAQEGAEELLRKVRARYDRAGVSMPSVLVRFRDLTVTGRVMVMRPAPTTRCGKLRQAVVGSLRHLVGAPAAPLCDTTILDGCSGVLCPGRFTILLGPPGAGKTCLLRALAGQLKQERNLRASCDELTYNGQPLESFIAEHTASYIPQIGQHFEELSCRETLDFAAFCRATDAHMGAGETARLDERERALGITPDRVVACYMTALAHAGRHSLITDLMLRLLGLESCADTFVGGPMVRGISGGQRRRVTLGEMLVGPMAPLLADEVSTGLDSANTHDICFALRALCHTMQSTVLVALLQPSPEVLELADDVWLLAAGRLVFQGPRELALPFFADQGLACPPQKGPADFLQSVVTLSDQRQYWSGGPGPYSFVGAQQLEAAFHGTPTGQELLAKLARSEDVTLEHRTHFTTHSYTQSALGLAVAVVRRGFKLQLRNLDYVAMRLLQNLVMGLCLGTLFLQQSTSTVQDGQAFMGVAYFSILCQQTGAFSAPTLMLNRLPTYFRQRDAKFYPAWAIALAEMLTQLPVCFAESWIWTLLVYFLVGFSTSPRLLAFWAIMLLTNLFTSSLFMAVAALCRRHTLAQAVQSTLNTVLLGSAGFLIAVGNMPVPWKAAYWSNPFAYFIRGVMINELTTPVWDEPAPSGQPVGGTLLNARGYGTEYKWVWVAIGVGCASYLLNVGFLVAALYWLELPAAAPVVTQKALLERKLARLGPGQLSDGEKCQVAGPAGSKEISGNTGPTNGQLPVTADVERGAGVAAAAVRKLMRHFSTVAFRSATLSFKDVCYSVPMPQLWKGLAAQQNVGPADGCHAGRLLLLHNITGCFQPGVLIALMGASGAGKTLLLDVLAGRTGRLSGGLVTGDIRVNGRKVEGQMADMVNTGYVEQSDVHVPHATVEEAVQFSARLRLPSSTPAAELEAFVQETLELVELTSSRHAPVGMPGIWGLSQEARKRLTLAVELVANPSIIILDEPTSGLDGRAAAIVMRAVQNISSIGRTVVATIHQPSPQIFESFQELLLLKRGGRMAFWGLLGGPGAPLMASYFQAVPGVPSLRPEANTADWLLEVTSPASEAQLEVDFADIYATSKLCKGNEALVAKLSQAEVEPADGCSQLAARRSPEFLKQLMELLRRNWQQYLRLQQYQLMRLYITTQVGLLFGWLFWNNASKLETWQDVTFLVGCLYMSTIFFGRQGCLMVQEVVHTRRSVFYRERGAGIYGTVPYALAEFLVEVPFSILNTIVFSTLVFLMLGFQCNHGHFGWFFLFLLLTSLYFNYIGMVMVHLAPNLQLARVYAAFLLPLFNLFCGYLKVQPKIPAGWIWLYWVDPMSYTLYGLVDTQLGSTNNMYISTPDGALTITVPQMVAQYFGYNSGRRGWAVAVLMAFCIILLLTTIASLKWLRWHRR